MHCEVLRGADCKIQSDNLEISYAEYCRRLKSSIKLGVYSPDGIEAVGASNLILLFVTTFYDKLRSKSDDFNTYPDFYTFQCKKNLTDYGILDIYPIENNRLIQSGADALFDEIIKKDINILLLPQSNSVLSKFSNKQLSTLEEKIDACYLYAQNGKVQNANLIIETDRADISNWIKEVLSGGNGNYSEFHPDTNLLVQSFQAISFSSYYFSGIYVI